MTTALLLSADELRAVTGYRQPSCVPGEPTLPAKPEARVLDTTTGAVYERRGDKWHKITRLV